MENTDYAKTMAPNSGLYGTSQVWLENPFDTDNNQHMKALYIQPFLLKTFLTLHSISDHIFSRNP